MKQNTFFDPRQPKNFQPRTNRYPNLDPNMSFLVPQGRPRVPRDAKVEAPRIAKKRFGQQDTNIHLQKPKICNLEAISKCQGPAAEGAAHKTIPSNIGD